MSLVLFIVTDRNIDANFSYFLPFVVCLIVWLKWYFIRNLLRYKTLRCKKNITWFHNTAKPHFTHNGIDFMTDSVDVDFKSVCVRWGTIYTNSIHHFLITFTRYTNTSITDKLSKRQKRGITFGLKMCSIYTNEK